jgi:hypothetical protein
MSHRLEHHLQVGPGSLEPLVLSGAVQAVNRREATAAAVVEVVGLTFDIL